MRLQSIGVRTVGGWKNTSSVHRQNVNTEFVLPFTTGQAHIGEACDVIRAAHVPVLDACAHVRYQNPPNLSGLGDINNILHTGGLKSRPHHILGQDNGEKGMVTGWLNRNWGVVPPPQFSETVYASFQLICSELAMLSWLVSLLTYYGRNLSLTIEARVVSNDKLHSLKPLGE
jgi:hypothetical protein